MRAVKAHLGTSPFATRRPAGAQPRTHQRNNQRRAGADPAAQPQAEVAVPRAVVCYWRNCSQAASVRIGFQAPSLLAGDTRDYCPRHTKQVALQPGTAILGRIQVEPEEPAPSDR